MLAIEVERHQEDLAAEEALRAMGEQVSGNTKGNPDPIPALSNSPVQGYRSQVE